jgi:hypothetical protein
VISARVSRGSVRLRVGGRGGVQVDAPTALLALRSDPSVRRLVSPAKDREAGVRPKVVSADWHRLRANVACLIDWLRIAAKNGWLGSTRAARKHGERKFQETGQRIASRLAEMRVRMGLAQPYGPKAAELGLGQLSRHLAGPGQRRHRAARRLPPLPRLEAPNGPAIASGWFSSFKAKSRAYRLVGPAETQAWEPKPAIRS